MIFKKKKDLLIYISLVQDFSVLYPILTRLKKNDRSFEVLIDSKLESSEWVKKITESGFPFFFDSPFDKEKQKSSLKKISNYSQLLTACESSASPHKRSHSFTLFAKDAGLKTITLQHGLENIGLTYSDDEYPIAEVKFASDHILCFTNKEKLHPQISKATKDKVLEVGYWGASQDENNSSGNKKVLITENLHWSRYSADYRKFFKDSIQEVTNSFPEWEFFLRSHPAGLWSQSNEVFKGIRSFNNQYTSHDYLREFSLLITTPSTTVLNASAIGLPVLLIEDDLNLKHYEPIALIGSQNPLVDAFARFEMNSADFQGRSKEFFHNTCYGTSGLDLIEKYLFNF